jgi:hypothetical protein
MMITGKLYFENGTHLTLKIKEVIDEKLSIGNGFKQKYLLKMSEFCASPLFLERCNYNAMIEFVTIRKLKG